MPLYLPLSCFLPRVTRLKSWSLHLNTFNQFWTRFKTRYKYDWKQNASTICHLFRDVAIHNIAELRTLHSSNKNAFLGFLVECWLRHTETVRFIVFDDAIEFYHGVPAVLVQSQTRAYVHTDFWIVLTQRNTGCKTWNNDHHALYMVSETACHVFSLYDWLYKSLVNFSHFLPCQYSNTA